MARIPQGHKIRTRRKEIGLTQAKLAGEILAPDEKGLSIAHL